MFYFFVVLELISVYSKSKVSDPPPASYFFMDYCMGTNFRRCFNFMFFVGLFQKLSQS